MAVEFVHLRTEYDATRLEVSNAHTTLDALQIFHKYRIKIIRRESKDDPPNMLPASHISHTVKDVGEWYSSVSWDQSSWDRWDRWYSIYGRGSGRGGIRMKPSGSGSER